MLNLAGKELRDQESMREVMAVLRFSGSCMSNTLRVQCGITYIKSSNSVGQILEVTESTKENTIGINIRTGKY